MVQPIHLAGKLHQAAAVGEATVGEFNRCGRQPPENAFKPHLIRAPGFSPYPAPLKSRERSHNSVSRGSASGPGVRRAPIPLKIILPLALAGLFLIWPLSRPAWIAP